jgi:hypothetical protein
VLHQDSKLVLVMMKVSIFSIHGHLAGVKGAPGEYHGTEEFRRKLRQRQYMRLPIIRSREVMLGANPDSE